MRLTIGGKEQVTATIPETGVKGCILNGDKAGKLGACAAASCTLQVMESITKRETKNSPEPAAVTLAAGGQIACSQGRELIEKLY